MPCEMEQPRYLTGWKLASVISSIFVGNFLIALDTSIINVAIPHISTEFDALQDVAWYGTSYLLTIMVFQPVWSVLYRFFSVQISYRSCIFIFEVGSVLCAAAISSHMFILGRAVAGIGAAGTLQGALSIISLVVPLEKRSMYMGIVISVFVVTVCIGPLLGGVFTTHSTWRWCFWINLPTGTVVMVLLFIFLRIDNEDSPERKLPLKNKLAHLEPIGFLTFFGAVTCLLLAFQWGGQREQWHSATIIGLFIGFGLLMILFGWSQWYRGDKAMIPLRVLRQRTVWTSSAVLFWLGSATYIVSFYLPFYFQAVQGVDAITSGVRFIPLILPQIVSLIVVGALITRIGHYVPVMLIGEIVCSVGTGLLTRLTVHTPTLVWAIYLVVTGLGMGAAMQLPYTAIQIALSEKDVPIANAVAVFTWQLGGVVGIAVGQAISLNTILSEGLQLLPEASVKALIAAGSTNLQAFAASEAALSTIRFIWNQAITRVMFWGLASVIAAVPFTCGMEWLDAKQVAREKAEQAKSRDIEKRSVFVMESRNPDREENACG